MIPTIAQNSFERQTITSKSSQKIAIFACFYFEELFLFVSSLMLEETLVCHRYWMPCKVPKLLFHSFHFAQGGVLLDPTMFKYFSIGISVRTSHHICIHLKQPKPAKRTFKKCSVSKWLPKSESSFNKNSHVTKILKNTFPKEFFNEIWLKVEEHECIYIFVIKFEKIILFKNGGQNRFCDIAR